MNMQMKRDIIRVFVFTILIFVIQLECNQVLGSDDYIKKALENTKVQELDDYLKKESDFFQDFEISIGKYVKDAIDGKVEFNIIEFIKYQIQKEKDFIKRAIASSVSILAICVVLTIIKYFSEDLNSSISRLVGFVSIIIVFILVAKDLNYVKDLLQYQFVKFEKLIETINTFFIAITLSIGKIGILDFFAQYSKYILSITTKIIYNFTDIMTVVLIGIVIINNISDIINLNLLYKLLKRGTLIVFGIYIAVVVINFSVQGYIYYKTDNIFINSIKAISPSSIPMVGNAVNNFFSLFIKSVMLIKDIAGIIIILFVFSIFGSSLIRLVVLFLLYRITAALAEPLNEKISVLINELGDVLYIYFICLLTPIIVITSYYSIMMSYLNGIFG